jgi:hypothetical protein
MLSVITQRATIEKILDLKRAARAASHGDGASGGKKE